MKLKQIAPVLAAGLLALPAFASININDSTDALHNVLGVPNSTDLNSIVLNNTTGIPTFNTSSGSQYASYVLALASWSDVNAFGIYSLSDPSQKVAIFSGTQTIGANVVINISGTSITVNGTTIGTGGQYGFYLTTGEGITYLSHSGTANGENQFAWFASAGGYTLAMEDGNYAVSDDDYNDLVVKLTAVPEPSTVIAGMLLLLPLGIGTIRILRRKSAV